MTLDSTTALQTTLRTRLLTFAPLTGVSLADTLGNSVTGSGADGALFWDHCRDDITKLIPRWGILRLQNWVSGGDGQERQTGEMEVTFFGRPRSTQRVTLELCADLCDQAMLRYEERTALGLVGCWGRQRSTMPVFTSPADAEVHQIRCVYTLVLWPDFITQYHDS